MRAAKAAELLALADWAEQRPKGYDQDMWLTVLEPDSLVLMEETGVPVERMREDSCTTSACLAGQWVIEHAPAGTLVIEGETLVFPGEEEPANLADWAAADMGLSYDQALTIFYAPAKDAIARLRYVAEHSSATREEIESAVPSRLTIPDRWFEESQFALPRYMPVA